VSGPYRAYNYLALQQQFGNFVEDAQRRYVAELKLQAITRGRLMLDGDPRPLTSGCARVSSDRSGA